MDRTVNSPRKEYLTDEEVAKWLNMRLELFKHLVKIGIFPQGVQLGERTFRWHWLTVVGLSALMPHLMGMWDKQPPSKSKKISAS